MVSKRQWIIGNISLGFIAFLLVLNLFDVSFVPLGKAAEELKQEALCWVEWDEEMNPLEDIDLCCLEARKQLSCERSELGDKVWGCQTGYGKVLKYWLNNAAYDYCRQQRIWK